MGRICKKGFTLIELLVVIAIIALLLSIVMPALGRAKLYAQRIICSNDLRQQSLGIILYANENDSKVMENSVGGWLWDVSFLTTEQMMRFAGFSDNKTFFCASNKISQHDDARFWQYSWLYPGPYPQKVSHRDESGLTVAQRRGHYRVLPFVYMLDKVNAAGNSILPQTLDNGEKAKWISRLTDTRNAGSTIMVMDAVISQGNNTRFFEITSGGIGTLSAGTLTDNTNHPSRQRLGPGQGEIKPEGANVCYADGHVTWEQFGGTPPQNSIMKQKITTGGQRFWW